MKVDNRHRLVNDAGQLVPFVRTPNQGGPLAGGQPEYLIIHYTAGATADGAISWFRNPAAQASAQLVIGHNGATTQMATFDQTAWHAGRSSWKGINGLNSHSVGIEIVNWGLLHGGSGNWKSWAGSSVPDNRVIMARHKNFEPQVTHAWEVFDEDQLEAAIAAAAAIVSRYAIPEANILGHDDIAPIRKQDPGPAFPMSLFKAKVFGRAEATGTAMKVQSATGLNLRTGPGISFAAITLLADGTKIIPMGSDGVWFEVTTLNAAGAEDKTGWVHSKWLVPA